MSRQDATCRVGFYPGTFDPVTKGHLDIINRASKLFDRVIIGVARNDEKKPLFTMDERVALLEDELRGHPARERLKIVGFDTLLTRAVEREGAHAVIRGLRSGADFEFESQLTGVLTRLAPEVETVFLMASEAERGTASKIVKEIARLGGDVDAFLSRPTAAALLRKVR